jgi:hypothetical protein
MEVSPYGFRKWHPRLIDGRTQINCRRTECETIDTTFTVQLCRSNWRRRGSSLTLIALLARDKLNALEADEPLRVRQVTSNRLARRRRCRPRAPLLVTVKLAVNSCHQPLRPGPTEAGVVGAQSRTGRGLGMGPHKTIYSRYSNPGCYSRCRAVDGHPSVERGIFLSPRNHGAEAGSRYGKAGRRPEGFTSP